MGHVPSDENHDEFMKASAEEWSKPQKPPDKPDMASNQVNRWGSPIPENGTRSDSERWGSQPARPSTPDNGSTTKKGGIKWWVIVLILVILLCLCLCILLIGLPFLGYNVVPVNVVPF